MSERGKRLSAVILRIFYLLTPFFIILDVFFQFNVRVSFFEFLPIFKYLYYAVLLLCCIFIWKNPESVNKVASMEGKLLLGIIILGFGVTYIHTIFNIAQHVKDNTFPAFFRMENITNIGFTAGLIYLNQLRCSFSKN